MTPDTDTIFALASGASPAAIAVLRISGPRAGNALDSLAGLPRPPARRLTLRLLRDGGGAVLDQAMLAWLPVAEQHEHLAAVPRLMLSERTVTDIDALLARLAQVRAQGHAVSDGENAYGLRTVAAPVLDGAGRPIAGVSMTIAAAPAGR